MAKYIIGDVHGCFHSLMRLLEKLGYSDSDTLWFTGDLVNRGRYSLEVLTFAQGLGGRCQSVLGNHDLYLLAVYHGHERYHDKDAFGSVLQSPHCDDLMSWLAQRPFLICDQVDPLILVHAGLPNWPLATLTERHQWLCQRFADNAWLKAFLLDQLMGNTPLVWHDDHSSFARARLLVNLWTRMRYVNAENVMDFAFKGIPNEAPNTIRPWFTGINADIAQSRRVVFGHWSALADQPITTPNVTPLDTGCAWKGRLSAYEVTADVLISDEIISVPYHPKDIA